MRPSLAFFMIAVSAVPAAAQTTQQCMANGPFVNCNGSDGSYTTCNRTGTIVNCNTTGGNAAAGGSTAVPGSAADGMASFAMAIRRIRENKLRARVGKALQAGDCPTALHEAVALGDLSYATQVKAYCAQR